MITPPDHDAGSDAGRRNTHDLTGSWLSAQWRQVVEERFPPSLLAQAEAQARAASVTLAIHPGQAEAELPPKSARPWTSVVRVGVLSRDEWDRLIEAMAREAIYTAKLFWGELPAAVAELAAQLRIELVPRRPEALHVECTCGSAGLCAHTAIVAHLLTARLDTDPTLIFKLRGMPLEQLRERLRQARQLHTHGIAPAHPDPFIPESQETPLPLEACMGSFWRGTFALADLEQGPFPRHGSHALLRRL
ncbi:MAG: SWIM zinc finger family protein, partial [Planctomycetota bacterium]